MKNSLGDMHTCGK